MLLNFLRRLIGITRASCTYNLLFVNPTVNECMAIIFQSIPHHTPAQQARPATKNKHYFLPGSSS